MDGNNLTGTIPPSWTSLPALQRVDVQPGNAGLCPRAPTNAQFDLCEAGNVVCPALAVTNSSACLATNSSGSGSGGSSGGSSGGGSSSFPVAAVAAPVAVVTVAAVVMGLLVWRRRRKAVAVRLAGPVESTKDLHSSLEVSAPS